MGINNIFESTGNKGKIFIVGGSFDDEGGRPSGLVEKICQELINANEYDVRSYNGGWFSEIESIINTTPHFDCVFWWANVPNDKPKIRNVKDLSPNTILVVSKRNDNQKYSFDEVMERAKHANADLCIQFSKESSGYKMKLFNMSGNVLYDGYSTKELVSVFLTALTNILAPKTNCK